MNPSASTEPGIGYPGDSRPAHGEAKARPASTEPGIGYPGDDDSDDAEWYKALFASTEPGIGYPGDSVTRGRQRGLGTASTEPGIGYPGDAGPPLQIRVARRSFNGAGDWLPR